MKIWYSPANTSKEDDPAKADRDDTTSDAESDEMFDMFTGKAQEPREQPSAAPEAIDEFGSRTSLQSIGQHEHGKHDDAMQLRERTPESTVTERSSPPDLRALNAAATEAYRWPPVPDQTTVRVLDLLPANGPEEPVQGRMKLHGKSMYRAVSYFRKPIGQNDGPMREIRCDGCILRVTPDIYDTLRRIRNQLDRGTWKAFGERPCVWLDVVCIDQNDVLEQQESVFRIGDVFHNSQGTIIDLGHAYESSDLVVEHVMDQLIKAQDDPSDGTDMVVDIDQTSLDVTRFVLQDLLRHPWFSQLNSVEEMAASPIRTVLFGQSALPFKPFFDLLSHLGLASQSGLFQEAPRFDSTRPRTWIFANLVRYRGMLPAKPELSVSTLIAPLISVSCGCQKWGPLEWCGRERCGLRAPPESLYLSLGEMSGWLAILFAQENSVPAVLALACAFPSPPGLNALPSWVPNWRTAFSTPITDASTAAMLSECFETRGGNVDIVTEPGRCEQGFGPARRPLPGEQSHTTVIQDIWTGRPLLHLRAWILERAMPGTKVSEINWEQTTAHVGIEMIPTINPPANKWTDDERRERLTVMNVDEEWPAVGDDEVVMFFPGSQLMFVLALVPMGWGCWRLVRFLRRTVPVRAFHFAFVHPGSGDVWAFAHLAREPDTLQMA